MYRVLVAASLLCVAFGENSAAAQKAHTASAQKADAASTSTVASSKNAVQQEQRQQHQQHQQAEQKHWKTYVDEYVPSAYRKEAIKDDERRAHAADSHKAKDASSQSSEKKSATKASSAIDLLSLDGMLGGSSSTSDAAAKKSTAASTADSTAASKTKQSTNQVATSSDAKQQQQHQERQQRQQHQQHQQRQQAQQKQQKQQKDWMNYVKEYVPAAYQKNAVHDDEKDKDSSKANAADSKKAQTSEKQSAASGAGSAIELLATKGSGNPGDQYIHQYAGEYQKYVHRNHKRDQQDVVHSARDAQNKTQLDAWRSHEKQTVKLYVPAEYAHYANRHVDDKYKQRLDELQHRKQSTSLSHSAAVESIINLDAAPAQNEHKEHKEHLNATQRKALRKEQCEHLRVASNDTVKKVAHMSESLKKAAHDETALDATAARPVKNIFSAFGTTSDELDKSIDELQKEMKSKTVSADFENRLVQTKEEVETLRGDELHALDQAHREASRAVNHATRGAQSEAREDARKVWSMSDHMARKDESYQDMTDKLENDVEVATDGVENHADELGRRTQDRLDDHVSKAKDQVRKNADSRLDALTEVQGQLQEMQAETAKAAKEAKEKKENAATEHKKSETFLAQPVDFSPAPLSALALVAGSFACLSFWLLFRSKRNRTVELPANVLG